MAMDYRFNKTTLEADLSELTEPIHLYKVDETKFESLWDSVVREYHYLGYESVIGARTKYLIVLGTRLIGAISFCSASFKLGPRDKYLGWDEQTRLEMLPHLINNNRFLILPWIKVRNLASHILSVSLKQARLDWVRWYGVEPYMVETFVDSEKYNGTCYIAANWTYLGTTKGFGRIGKGFVYHGHTKSIYVKIMNRRFSSAFHPNLDRLCDERKELLSMITSIPIYYSTILDDIGIKKVTPEALNGLLERHLSRYTGFLNRKELVGHFIANIMGRLSNLERKSIEPICLALIGPDQVRPMQNFFTRSEWDHEAMLKEYQKELSELLSDPNGMITGDGCDFPKKGGMSAGVHRQHCGPLGKTDNCQASVMVGYASVKGYGLLSGDLYLPEAWHTDDYADKRKKCCVPENLSFETKNQILLKKINGLYDAGIFQGKYVGVDSAFGRDHNFLDSLPDKLIYFADVPCNHLVFTSRPEMLVPEYKGRGRRPTGLIPSIPACEVSAIATDDSVPWNDIVLGMGSQGPIIAKDKCVRVVEIRDHGPGKDVWLYMRKLEDNSIKYSLCNASSEASLDEIRTPALMRWSIEQSFHECKTYLGMDHYELRSWHGWRRWMLLTFIAHQFVLKLRREFSVENNQTGPAPYVEPPVPLKDYAKELSAF
jgi:SRSO17 transposase